nr:diguanylate cyclase [Ardenticatena sp.]
MTNKAAPSSQQRHFSSEWGAFALFALSGIGLSLWQRTLHPLAWLTLAWLPVLALPMSCLRNALALSVGVGLVLAALAWYTGAPLWMLPVLLITPSLAQWALHRTTHDWRASHTRVQARDDFVHSVLSTLGHGLLLLDLEGHVVRVNTRWNDLAAAATPPMPRAFIGQPYLRLLVEYAHRHQHERLQRFLEQIGGLLTGTHDILQEELAFETTTLRLMARALSFHNQHVLVFTLTDISEWHHMMQSLHNAAEQTRALVEGSGDVYFRQSRQTMAFEYLSPNVEQVLSYTSDTLNEKGFEFIIRESQPHNAYTLHRIEQYERWQNGDTRPFVATYQIHTGDGRTIWLQERALPWYDEQGDLRGWQGTWRDITIQKWAEQALRRKANKANELIAAVAQGILTLDARGFIRDANPTAIEMLGLNPLDIEARRLFVGSMPFLDEHGIPLRGKNIPALKTLRSGEALEDEVVQYIHPNGDILWFTLSTRPLGTGNSYTPTGVVITLTDITALRREQEKLRYQSTHDAMTGLHNRAYFEDVCAALQQSDRSVGVVVVDLDGLKAANDTYGHEAGDELIKRAAQVLQASFRKNDIVARLGGDEFIVLLPNTSPDIVQKAMYRLRHNIRRHNEETQHPIPLSMSIGGAFARTSTLLEAAIKRADERMYEDKRRRKAGRDAFS